MLRCGCTVCRDNYLESEGWSAVMVGLEGNITLTSLSGAASPKAVKYPGDAWTGGKRKMDLCESILKGLRPELSCKDLSIFFAPLLTRNATTLKELNLRYHHSNCNIFVRCLAKGVSYQFLNYFFLIKQLASWQEKLFFLDKKNFQPWITSHILLWVH